MYRWVTDPLTSTYHCIYLHFLWVLRLFYPTIHQKCMTHKPSPSIIMPIRSLHCCMNTRHHFPVLPDSVNPDWWRFLTGTLVGEVRAEADGVPPLDMGENSDTGPSYMPLGTAFSVAIYEGNKNKTLQFCTGLCSIQFIEKQRERQVWVLANTFPRCIYPPVGCFWELCVHVNCKFHVLLEIGSRFCWQIVEKVNHVALSTVFLQCKQDIFKFCWLKTDTGEKKC